MAHIIRPCLSPSQFTQRRLRYWTRNYISEVMILIHFQNVPHIYLFPPITGKLQRIPFFQLSTMHFLFFFFFWKQTFKEERNYSFSRFIFCCMSSRIDLVKLNKYLSQGMFSFPQIRCAHKKILPNVMNNVTDVCHITGSLHQLILLVFTQSFWLPKAMQKLDLFTYLYYIHH